MNLNKILLKLILSREDIQAVSMWEGNLTGVIASSAQLKLEERDWSVRGHILTISLICIHIHVGALCNNFLKTF